MALIVKILLLSIAYQSVIIVTCQPLDNRQLFASNFQNNHRYKLQDVIYFPDLPYYSYVNHEPSTERNHVALNTHTDSVHDLKIRNYHTLPATLRNTEKATTSEPKIDCSTLSDKQCAEYEKFIHDFFGNIDTYKRNEDSTKDNLIGEGHDKVVQGNQDKNVNDYLVCNCNEETTTDDYDTSTDDDISFRLPPPIVAALLG